MTRALQILGLSLAAMLALGAAGPSTAGAATEFHSEISNPVLTGAQTKSFGDKLGFDAGAVECETIAYAGSLPGGDTTGGEIKLKPTYSGCTATFGASITVDVNECEYAFHSEGGKVDVLCPGATKAISITAPGCVVTMPEQSGLSGVAEYTNTGSGTSREITIAVEISGIKYEEHNKGFFPTCKANTVAKSNGAYHGSTTVTAENGAKEQKRLWVDAFEFHSEVSSPVLTGEQSAAFADELVFDAGAVECESITYAGSLPGGDTTGGEIKLKPAYSGCTAGFGASVTIDVNECEYAFHAKGGKADILCPGATKRIAITTAGCLVTVPEQSGLSGVAEYTNTGSGSSREITIDVEISGIKYEEQNTDSASTCVAMPPQTNGSHTGNTTVIAENLSQQQKGLWVEGLEFHSEVSNPVLTGIQPAAFNDRFTFDAGPVECENISYAGSLPGGGTTGGEIKLQPTYSGCTAGFGLFVVIDVNGCEYVFHAGSGNADLVCPGPTKAMSITAPGCVVTVPEQSGLGGIAYTNAGSGASREITVDLALSGAEYEEHNKGFVPTCKNGRPARTNGAYTSETTAVAETGQGLWIEGSEFHSASPKSVLTGAQTKSSGDLLTVDMGEVKCNTITYTGSLSGGGATATQLNLKPSFGGCTYSFGVSATINANECEYVFHSDTGKVDLTCPGATKAISIALVNCTVTIPEQSGLEGAAYTNAGSGSSRDVTIDVSISGIKYEEHNKGFFPTCKANTFVKSNGTYSGKTTVTAENGTVEQKGLWVE